ncbi:MAG: peptidase S8 [Moraxellaceae bacterium]|nr:MAG: peptidase S8 [Moraxellaceae bacterium]
MPFSKIATVISIMLGSLVVNANPTQGLLPDNAMQNLEDAQQSYIFVYKQGLPRDRVNQLSHALVRQGGGTVRHIFTVAIKGFSANISAQGAARLAANNPSIAYFEPNGVAWAFAKPPWAGGGDEEEEAIQVTPWGVARVGGPIDGRGLDAWIIDTGIDLDHPDLNVGYGANFVSRGKNSPNDGQGHGTHVAGTIGAIDNSIDVVGVASGATVHPVRVLDNSGSGTIDGVIAGVDWVAENASAGDCANMSLGASGHFESLHAAVSNAAEMGIYFAIAAGNSSKDASDYEPAHVEGDNIYTISAIDSNDEFAGFSNFGNPTVDYAAPGVNVLSTKKGGGTTAKSGTSMAAPHACGLLLFSAPLNSYGTAISDPDGNPDPIAHY